MIRVHKTQVASLADHQLIVSYGDSRSVYEPTIEGDHDEVDTGTNEEVGVQDDGPLQETVSYFSWKPRKIFSWA